ncbi:hypothetical protein CO683_38650 [Bradyrhizobium ottawaense]|uniref:hypothetical protein n=1 Tax=Bradyrhizobium ottawaense TaxID=931866 RepID=UPI000BEA1651|nr:hypothetical protein [Bradyrhizobium ottawaense]PDT64343.1 hypothetical protein CO683_38650 [Bradyrhizobium ottawaense]
MTETSATIIDFTTYRMKRAAKLSNGTASWLARYEAVASFCFFWSLLALIPFGSLDLPASEQEPS